MHEPTTPTPSTEPATDPTDDEIAARWAAEVARHPWLPLARRALWLHVQGDPERAARMVTRIATEHGVKAIPLAMMSWIDTAMRHRRPIHPGQAVRVAVLNATTGAVTEDLASVPEPARSAVALVYARFTDDEQTFRAIVDQVPGDREWRALVSAVLSVCSANVRYTLPDL